MSVRNPPRNLLGTVQDLIGQQVFARSASGTRIGLVTATKAGLVSAFPNDDTKFFDGKGNYSKPGAASIGGAGLGLILCAVAGIGPF